MKPIFTFLLSCLLFHVSHAQNNREDLQRMQVKPAIYTAQKTILPVIIDGMDTDLAWQSATVIDQLIDIQGSSFNKPRYNTQIKMLWDEKNLYLYARLDEPHIWGTLTKHDDIIYHNNDFEIFIKPYENQAIYYEIEVNSLNTILDLMMNKPYRFGGEANLNWDIKGLQSAVYVNGTNNNPNDIDQYWSVEMAIPFTSLQSFGRKATPTTGDYWRLNFSRVQWQHELLNGNYQRKLKNNKLVEEDNWVWSPIGLIDIHYPEQWGYLQFVDQPMPAIAYPASEAIERFTWNLFYVQKLHHKTNQKYTSSLSNLIKQYDFLVGMAKPYTYEITTNAAKTFYIIEIKDSAQKITTSIDSRGNYNIQYDK